MDYRRYLVSLSFSFRFFLEDSCFATPQICRKSWKALAAAGLIYSIPLLFEIRFSPQIHYWVYGYYSSDFIQEMRQDGAFRPMVFMGHGLAACFFAMTTVVASAALWRMRILHFSIQRGCRYSVTFGFVLILCKKRSGSEFMEWFSSRWFAGASLAFQARLALLLMTLALSYPILRLAEIFPTEATYELAAKFR